MRRLLTMTTATLFLAGCGGGGDDAKSGGETPKKDAASAPSPDAVLACMKKEGLDAKDQSTSTGEKIGIDYPAGRLVVSFEDSAEDAKSYASVAESNGETAVVKGSVAITVPDDPAASTAQQAVEGCVDSA
jgi:hypothetical protein